MSEADEIAENIAKAFGSRPRTWDEARLLVTRFYGTPAEIGYQLHDNIAEGLLDKFTPQSCLQAAPVATGTNTAI